MNLLAEARAQIQRILKAEFSIEIVIIDKTNKSYSITGLMAKNHVQIDVTTGALVNAKNTHITISEKDLISLGCTTRNSKGIVDLVGFKAIFKDSTDVNSTYKVIDVMPDETLGLITLTLGDYK